MACKIFIGKEILCENGNIRQDIYILNSNLSYGIMYKTNGIITNMKTDTHKHRMDDYWKDDLNYFDFLADILLRQEFTIY
jgi:hypothetical protein